MSLWFISAAILPEMIAEVPISPTRQAFLSSAVQAGFVVGAVLFAVFAFADRYDPRRVLALCALLAAGANAGLLYVIPGGNAAIGLRFLTGALLAGVYPVGMKIAVGWGTRDRGFLVGLLVGALTLGSAAPHLVAIFGGADWRAAIVVTSIASALGGLIILVAQLGPHHARAPAFEPRAILLAWTDRRIRLAYAGYLGHMWELYAMWAWIGVAAAVSYSHTLSAEAAGQLAKLTAFLSIGIGGIASIIAGLMADRIGRANITIIAMAVSGSAALATAFSFGGPVWLTFALIMVWGLAIVPDSAQFSALVADAAPADQAGSLLSLQTALGFTLTIATVQATPILADIFGWPAIMALMAIGPAYGIIAMARLRRLQARG